MGFLKNLFDSKPISEEEQARRMGKKYVPEKPVKEMTHEEQLRYWSRFREMTDLDERLHRMEELADAGFVSAYTTLIDTLFERADVNNEKVPLDQLEYWAKRAADSGNICGHYYLGLVYETPEYQNKDMDTYMGKAFQEYLLAMENENQAAAQRLLHHWRPDLSGSEYSAEEQSAIQTYFRTLIEESLKSELDRLQAADDEKACCALGQMYFYGIVFEQDIAKAKGYFKRLADSGNRFGQNMLTNPLFDEDDEDEEE